jgi:hypothetical protein
MATEPKPKITLRDLRPGVVIQAPRQGTCITSIVRSVTVYWVGPELVHYRFASDNRLHNTTIERFLEIVNQA